jgi:hypothetical protein
MIYWILTDMEGNHARQHDGLWESTDKKSVPSDEVERFHRYRDAVAKAKKLRAKGCQVKPQKRECVAFYWRLPPNKAGEQDLAEIIEFRTRRQADAWKKRAIAEGCEVEECMGTAKKTPRKRKKK